MGDGRLRMTKLELVLGDPKRHEIVKRVLNDWGDTPGWGVQDILVSWSCPSEFGLEDCEYNSIKNHCCVSCEECWNEEVEE